MCVCVLVVVYTLIGVRLSGLHINIAFFFVALLPAACETCDGTNVKT